MFTREPTVFKLIKKNDADALRKYLTKHPEALDARNKPGQTPLINAAYLNSHISLRVILEFQPNLNAQSNQGNTALHLSADRGYAQIVSTLIDAGARTDITNNSGATARDLATSGVDGLFAPKEKEDDIALPDTMPTGFTKQADHIVAITAQTETPALSITSVYNFQARTVSYLSATKGAAPNVQAFKNAASPSELKAAAAFLESEQGNTYGFKPALIK